ncbi:Alpha/beta hydrolase fold-3 [Penicillium italicum]|uniref:Alpha/beta hydrolase fold-3 n=1 Tax=Penicillium italicum TaxID=40296 RepID=A0A0A2KMY4_PENIT|nr:Alpha/beta hydrolase fold-3 [Penicillium italicum]
MSIPSSSKLDGFEIIQHDYKYIGDHGIRVDILTPRTNHVGPRPLIIRIHGGGLMMGDSLFMDWWPQWISDLALQKGAVIVSPNYRLLPEATGAEIYTDIEDLWTWLHSAEFVDLLANQSTPTTVDLSRILVSGDSAGGLIGLYLALAHPTEIRSAAVAYPFVDPSSEAFSSPRAKPPFNNLVPESVVQESMKAVVLDTAKSSIITPDSLSFMLATIQHGAITSMYERGSKDVPREVLYPMRRLEQPNFEIPQGGIAVIHGRQDTVVPLGDVEKFIARANEVTKDLPGNEKITLTVQDGEHGFDATTSYKEPWLREAIKSVVDAWLE